MPVKINEPWQVPMTRCALETLRLTAPDVKILVCETGTAVRNMCEDTDIRAHHVETHTGGCNSDANVGFEMVETTWTVYTSNDIFVRPGWKEALIDCFMLEDCGVATLASGDLRSTHLGQNFGKKYIAEGVYGPFMMFRSEWRFDADRYPGAFGDTDLVARIYESGKRAYRNYSVVIEHLTHSTLGANDFEPASRRFAEDWGEDPKFVVRALVQGMIL